MPKEIESISKLLETDIQKPTEYLVFTNHNNSPYLHGKVTLDNDIKSKFINNEEYPPVVSSKPNATPMEESHIMLYHRPGEQSLYSVYNPLMIHGVTKGDDRYNNSINTSLSNKNVRNDVKLVENTFFYKNFGFGGKKSRRNKTKRNSKKSRKPRRRSTKGKR